MVEVSEPSAIGRENAAMPLQKSNAFFDQLARYPAIGARYDREESKDPLDFIGRYRDDFLPDVEIDADPRSAQAQSDRNGRWQTAP